MHRRILPAIHAVPGCRSLLPVLLLVAAFRVQAQQSPYQSADDFAKYAMKLRESAIFHVEPNAIQPLANNLISPTFAETAPGRYPWKVDITTTVFWIGERPTRNNPVPNTRSAWDANWVMNYGGFDNPDPSARRDFIPANFTPRQNPFYCALPYNNVTRQTTKPEASMVIPWFKQAYRKFGESVCRNRWIEIYCKQNNRTCYAQWSDCGPFRTDNWEYVFGNERPSPNINQGAGLDVSPAVRDFLGLNGMDVTSWRFVDFSEIPAGPWSRYGENNDFVLNSRATTERLASRTTDETGVSAR